MMAATPCIPDALDRKYTRAAWSGAGNGSFQRHGFTATQTEGGDAIICMNR